ncbi:MAG: branched-chain amino acid transport system ATP-binding protein [Myxococcota bacterium]|jgi:branched-chain amino acid transport system ATP-binding protein
MLSVDDIHVYYGNIHALKGVSFSIDEGEIVTLIGANGAGKSTTLRAIAGLNPTRTGQITYRGEALGSTPTPQRVADGLVLCPEGRQIFANLTVVENLRIGAYLRRDQSGVAADVERMFNFFPRLRERSGQRGGTLSGGEQQMLAISRALMSRPRLLLLDEPSLGLAPLIVKQIFHIIEQINREDGITVLLVEQNAHLALRFAHRAYVIETGQITMSGPARELLADPRVQEAYLGI